MRVIPPNFPLRLGIGSYTYAWAAGAPGYPVEEPLTPLELVTRAEGLGVAVVQIADNLPLDRLGDGEVALLARSAATRRIDLEVGTRGIASEHLRRYLALAVQLGSPILRVVIDRADHHPSPDEVVATLRPLLAEFSAAGVVLALENHDRFRAAVLVDMLQALASPWVGICLDTVNSFGALEGPPVVVPALAPWTVNLHVKDFVVRRAGHNMGFRIEGCPAGTGQLDIAWLLGQLAAAGRSCSAILELWTPPEAEVEATIAKEAAWAAQSIAALRHWITT